MPAAEPLLVPSTDGVVLALHQLGPGDPDARPLLLCHATGFCAHVWATMADLLPERRCYALDFRGYGDSTPPADDLHWNGFGDDVLAVVDHLGLADVQAVGHSKGGAALLLAEEARPGTFDRLVCFEPIVFPPDGGGGPDGSNPLAESARRRRDTFASAEEALERFGSRPPFDALDPRVLTDYVRHGFATQPDGSIRLKADREHEARTYEMGGQHGGFERLGEVRCPVLVCHGGDGAPPATIAPLIAGALPEAELRAFPELGHFGPLQDPAGFAEVVRTFLA